MFPIKRRIKLKKKKDTFLFCLNFILNYRLSGQQISMRINQERKFIRNHNGILLPVNWT